MQEFTFRETTAESKQRYLRFIADFYTEKLKTSYLELIEMPRNRLMWISKLDQKLSIL